MMKRAFTLLELLTVIAIMGLLSTIAIGGYRSAVRGMRNRGAMTVVQTFVDQVCQRAIVDRQTVIIYFYDELMQTEDEQANRDFLGAGMAVAVRTMGRVSAVDGAYILDEFNDLNVGTDELEEDEEGNDEADDYDKAAMRIYRMATAEAVDVSPKVEYRRPNEAFLLTGNDTGDVAAGGGSASGQNEKKLFVNAYRALNGNPFARGDAYGAEFASVRLPNGYFFGSSVPTTEGKSTSPIKKMVVKPDGTGAESVTVYTFKSLNSTQLESCGSTTLL